MLKEANMDWTEFCQPFRLHSSQRNTYIAQFGGLLKWRYSPKSSIFSCIGFSMKGKIQLCSPSHLEPPSHVAGEKHWPRSAFLGSREAPGFDVHQDEAPHHHHGVPGGTWTGMKDESKNPVICSGISSVHIHWGSIKWIDPLPSQGFKVDMHYFGVNILKFTGPQDLANFWDSPILTPHSHGKPQHIPSIWRPRTAHPSSGCGGAWRTWPRKMIGSLFSRPSRRRPTKSQNPTNGLSRIWQEDHNRMILGWLRSHIFTAGRRADDRDPIGGWFVWAVFWVSSFISRIWANVSFQEFSR